MAVLARSNSMSNNKLEVAATGTVKRSERPRSRQHAVSCRSLNNVASSRETCSVLVGCLTAWGTVASADGRSIAEKFDDFARGSF